MADSLGHLSSEVTLLTQQLKKARREAWEARTRLQKAESESGEKWSKLESALLVKTKALSSVEARCSELEAKAERDAEAHRAELEASANDLRLARSANEGLKAQLSQLEAALAEERARVPRTDESVKAEAVAAYKSSSQFAVDAVDRATQVVLDSLGQVIDRVKELQADFPVSEVPLFRVAAALREVPPVVMAEKTALEAVEGTEVVGATGTPATPLVTVDGVNVPRS